MAEFVLTDPFISIGGNDVSDHFTSPSPCPSRQRRRRRRPSATNGAPGWAG